MGHDHYHYRGTVEGKNLLLSVVLNCSITLSQIIGGLISGSLALLSDALHNFSDVLSLFFSYLAHKLVRRKASDKHTFGYKRAELFAAFINSIVLIGVALYLIYESYQRFLQPEVIDSQLVIVLSVLGIFFNGFSVILLKKDADKNINMRSAYLHLFSDMLSSVVILIGGILIYLFQWYWVDSILTFIIAIYLIFVGMNLLKEATKMLLLFTPKNLDINAIASAVHIINGVKKLHHIHLWSLNDDELHLEAHLDCNEDITISRFNEILNEIEELLYHKFKINHITIQPEYNKDDSKEYIVQD